MEQEYKIRAMEVEDVEAVEALEQNMFSQPWSAGDFISAIHDTHNIYLVVDYDGKIAAYCGMWCVLDEGQINNVAVDTKYRNQKIGFQMLTKLMEFGVKKGIQAFTLEVRESNHYAIRLYERLGFKSAGIRKDFYDSPKENAIIMWKYE